MSAEDFDITPTLAAKSDQLNADDLAAGPVIVQITGGRKVRDEKQPVILELSGGFNPWKPCKGMRRVLAEKWGANGRAYIGRWVKLYREPSASYGGKEIGGIRLKGMSDIPGPFDAVVRESRNQRVTYHIEKIEPPATGPDPLSTFIESERIDVGKLDAWLASVKASSLAEHTKIMRGQLLHHLQSTPALVESLRTPPTPTDGDARGDRAESVEGAPEVGRGFGGEG